MSEELKKYLEEKGFEATDCLPYYDEKILDLISKRVKDEARRELLREVKLYFFNKLEEIKKLTKGTKAKLVLYPNINDFYNWLEELEKELKPLK